MSRVPFTTQYKQTVHDPTIPSAPAPIYVTSGGGAIVVIVTFLFAVVIIYATSREGSAAVWGVIGSVLFYGVFVPVGLMAVNGGLALFLSTWQEQRTLRIMYQQPPQ